MVIHKNKSSNNLMLGVSLASLFVTIASGMILTSSASLALTQEKSARIEVRNACSMESEVSNAHTATVSAGSYKDNIGTTVVSVVCNDNAGFAVYAIGFTNDTDGTTTMNGLQGGTIATGLAKQGNTSSWSMKLSTYDNDAYAPTIENDYDDYNVVPDDYTMVASYPAAATSTNPSSFKTSYAAYVSIGQAVDTYTGQVKYVLVHPSNGEAPEKKDPEPYPVDPCIANPDCDATSGVTIQRAYEMAYTAAHKGMYEEITPDSNTFQYIDSWNGVQYQGNGRDVRFLIQDMTPSICNTATVIGSTALVLDIRDQTSYRIVKAADGRCWMQDNLALDVVANKNNLDPQNTNASQDAINNYITTKTSAIEAGWSTEAVSYGRTWQNDMPSQPFVNATYKTEVYQDSSDPLKDLARTEEWKTGVYYNLCAASVGTYCYEWNHDVDKNPNSAIDIDQDVCPAGWRIPTSGPPNTMDDGAEFFNLVVAIGSITEDDEIPYAKAYRRAMKIPLVGDITYYADPPQRIGLGGGFFWSSTYHDENSPYSSWVNADTSNTPYTTGFGRGMAVSIRCIAKTGTEPAPSSN